jgi:predicted transcriptional regulator
MDSKPRRPRDGLSLYLHESSRTRLSLLAEVLNISKTAVVAQAISRWVLQTASTQEAQWLWHIEKPFQEDTQRRKRGETFKMCARLPDHIIKQVEAFADTLHISLSAVVEQALLRWCREDPLVVNYSRSNGSITTEKEF